jgi:hypothetical protein
MTAIRAIGLSSAVSAVLVLVAADAAAQAPVQSFADVQSTLRVGQKVIVTDDTGATTKGKVVSILGNQLTIDGTQAPRRSLFARVFGWPGSYPQKRYALTEDSVRRIRKDDPTWNGGLIGGAIGGALGAASCAGDSSDDGTCVFGVIGLAVTGWIFGMWADDSIHRTIYVSPRGATITFAPLLDRKRVGVAASVRF